MKGHIRKRGQNSWAIVIDLPKDPKTGRRRQQWHTVNGNKKDAEKELRELLHSLEAGSYVKPQRLTLGEYLYRWLVGYVQTNCSTRTLDSYQSIVNRHLIPNLGSRILTQLHPQEVQQYYSRALTEGRTDGKGGLSARTVLHIHRVLVEALNYALRQGYIIRNVGELVDPPRAKKPKMKTLTPQEVAILLSVAIDTIYYPIIYTAVNTGLRQAELLGLTWRNVDLDLACLSITQVLYKRRGVHQFKEPKSEHSRRRLDLSPSLAMFLRQYKAEREMECLLLGKPLGDDDLVFSNEKGIAIDPGTLTHNFARIVKKAGLPRTRFHDLRHTFATLMLMAGIHPKIVSEMLGHSSVSFTLDTYSHVVPTMQQAAMKRLDELLVPELRQKNVCKMFATDLEKVELEEKFGSTQS